MRFAGLSFDFSMALSFYNLSSTTPKTSSKCTLALFFFIQNRIPEAGDLISIFAKGVSITAITSSNLTSAPFDLNHCPSHMLFRHRGMPIQPIFGKRICVTISLFLRIAAAPLFPLVTSAVGWLDYFKDHALSPGRRFYPGQAFDEFASAFPVFTNST